MKNLEDTTPRSLKGAQWLALPKWVRLYSIPVGVPAWLLLMAHSFSSDGILSPSANDVVVGFLASVALLQLAFVARAYWRMDI